MNEAEKRYLNNVQTMVLQANFGSWIALNLEMEKVAGPLF
jgi:hypothetical protein